MPVPFRRRQPAAEPAGDPFLPGGSCVLVPAPNMRQAAYASRQAITAAEKASLPYSCGGCGAPAWEPCASLTGLPASAPCPERSQAVTS